MRQSQGQRGRVAAADERAAICDRNFIRQWKYVAELERAGRDSRADRILLSEMEARRALSFIERDQLKHHSGWVPEKISPPVARAIPAPGPQGDPRQKIEAA